MWAHGLIFLAGRALAVRKHSFALSEKAQSNVGERRNRSKVAYGNWWWWKKRGCNATITVSKTIEATTDYARSGSAHKHQRHELQVAICCAEATHLLQKGDELTPRYQLLLVMKVKVKMEVRVILRILDATVCEGD